MGAGYRIEGRTLNTLHARVRTGGMVETPISQDCQLVLEVLRLRYWQHMVNEDLKKNVFKIPIHVAIGYEAIAVAVSNMMELQDQLVLSHRNMAYNMARAGTLKPIYDEYLLVPSGIARGKLGSMNLANPDEGVIYASSILGNNVSVACGLALAQQALQRNGLVIVLSGDGGIEEGQYHEAMVFAKSHRLTLLFIVENNNQSMSSTIGERRCPISLSHVCEGLGIPFRYLFGNDVFEYLLALRAVRMLAVERSTPICIEVRLAALNQHAGPTPGWPTDPKSISITNGLIVENTPNDPLFVLQQKIGSGLFAQLCAQVLAEKSGVGGW